MYYGCYKRKKKTHQFDSLPRRASLTSKLMPAAGITFKYVADSPENNCWTLSALIKTENV